MKAAGCSASATASRASRRCASSAGCGIATGGRPKTGAGRGLRDRRGARRARRRLQLRAGARPRLRRVERDRRPRAAFRPERRRRARRRARPGLRRAGMGAVGKHFPGHGFVGADSHTMCRSTSGDLTTIEQKDIAPYRAAIAGRPRRRDAGARDLSAGRCRAGGLLEVLAAGVLRGSSASTGLIFSDDLSMAGASAAGGIARARARGARRRVRHGAAVQRPGRAEAAAGGAGTRRRLDAGPRAERMRGPRESVAIAESTATRTAADRVSRVSGTTWTVA